MKHLHIFIEVGILQNQSHNQFLHAFSLMLNISCLYLRLSNIHIQTFFKKTYSKANGLLMLLFILNSKF